MGLASWPSRKKDNMGMDHSQACPEAVYYFSEWAVLGQARCCKKITWEQPKKDNMAFGLVSAKKKDNMGMASWPSRKKRYHGNGCWLDL